MGQDTRIGWATDSVNVWLGCREVSEACASCYAHGWARMWGRLACWGDEGRRVVRTGKALGLVRKLARLAERERVRRNVFVNSLSDFFEDLPYLEGPRREFLEGASLADGLTFLLLTKRVEHVLRLLARAEFRTAAGRPGSRFALGATAENQGRWDERVPLMVAVAEYFGVPSFVSVEPMLGPVSLRDCRPSWVIVGCLKVAGRCGCFVDRWALDLVAECQEKGVKVFVKQWPMAEVGRVVSENLMDWCPALRVRQMPGWMGTGWGQKVQPEFPEWNGEGGKGAKGENGEGAERRTSNIELPTSNGGNGEGES